MQGRGVPVLLVLLVLACSYRATAATADRDFATTGVAAAVPAGPPAAAAQAASSLPPIPPLICDGAVHELILPPPPYPPDQPPHAPIRAHPRLTCTRGPANPPVSCGAVAAYSCRGRTFSPIVVGSGETPGIIPPHNPVTFSLADGDASRFTSLQWTVVDVGSAGARLRGVYAAGSGLAPVSHDYAWTWNGQLNGSAGEYAPCTSCLQGEGIQALAVAAAPGAGFRGMQLSQLHNSTLCSGGDAGVNYDGIFFHGMTYACVQPSCGDTDLDQPGLQAFPCPAAHGWVANPAAANATDLADASCCLPVTCADVQPLQPGEQQHRCPAHSEFNQARNSSQPPTDAACCLPATCGNVAPVTAPGTPYACPAGSELLPGMSDAAPPSAALCCKPATCNDITPVSSPGRKFACPGSTERKPAPGDAPPSLDACCAARTCGDMFPVTAPNTSYSCPAHTSELNPVSRAAHPPTDEACCEPATCANLTPVSAPGRAFACPNGTEPVADMAGAQPPSLSACCKPATCADVAPVSKPGEQRYLCPPGTEFNPAMNLSHPPTPGACCLPATCSNVAPVTAPGTPYACPAGSELLPGVRDAAPPSAAVCCKASTCADLHPSTPPARAYACPADMSPRPGSAGQRPSEAACCVSAVDVAVTKRVRPAAPRPVGTQLHYVLAVSLASGTRAAEGVTLEDVLPSGLTALGLETLPDEADAQEACSWTPRRLRCSWPSLAPGEEKLVRLTAVSMLAGEHENAAAVATRSNDTAPGNNRARASITALGACCREDVNGQPVCSDVLAQDCLGSFQAAASCAVNPCQPPGRPLLPPPVTQPPPPEQPPPEQPPPQQPPQEQPPPQQPPPQQPPPEQPRPEQPPPEQPPPEQPPPQQPPPQQPPPEQPPPEQPPPEQPPPQQPPQEQPPPQQPPPEQPPPEQPPPEQPPPEQPPPEQPPPQQPPPEQPPPQQPPPQQPPPEQPRPEQPPPQQPPPEQPPPASRPPPPPVPEPPRGACCLADACTANMTESGCAGLWAQGASCAEANCSAPAKGACCMAATGGCLDGLDQASCTEPGSTWTKHGACKAGGICSGACCSPKYLTCSQQLRKNCGGQWALYEACRPDTCAPPPVPMPPDEPPPDGDLPATQPPHRRDRPIWGDQCVERWDTCVPKGKHDHADKPEKDKHGDDEGQDPPARHAKHHAKEPRHKPDKQDKEGRHQHHKHKASHAAGSGHRRSLKAAAAAEQQAPALASPQSWLQRWKAYFQDAAKHPGGQPHRGGTDHKQQHARDSSAPADPELSELSHPDAQPQHKPAKRRFDEDDCCPGSSCQESRAGSWACRPNGRCVQAGGPCGGHAGGHCCKSLACVWDYSGVGHGSCEQLSELETCAARDQPCSKRADCCSGLACRKGGDETHRGAGKPDKGGGKPGTTAATSEPQRTCQPVGELCKQRTSKCASYDCFRERADDCQALQAAAASSA